MNGSDLPSHFSAVEEKRLRSHGVAWMRPLYIPIPGMQTRRLRIMIPNTAHFHHLRMSVARRRRRGPVLLFIACLAVFFMVVLSFKGLGASDWSDQWQSGSGEPPTLVFRREDLQRIWKWEIDSGHYPSHREIPKEIGLKEKIVNPAIPRKKKTKPSRYRPLPAHDFVTEIQGAGPQRVYLDIQSTPPNVAYPPRPVPGSIADMDEIMKHCDFSKQKYVRDCLEVLRTGGGLDNGNRVRRGKMDDWKYIYQTNNSINSFADEDDVPEPNPVFRPTPHTNEGGPDAGLVKKRGAEWEKQIRLSAPKPPHTSSSTPCDDNNQRLFHMFWTGPFTDKPYLALLSFLFTQNTGLHYAPDKYPVDSPVCRPQFWLWINPGPAATVPNPSAVHDMFTQLKSNPWASPFLHKRFKDVIKFKLWNTTEQLDGVDEIKDEWRELQETLFNSGGHIISVKKQQVKSIVNVNGTTTSSNKNDDDDILNRTGSKSSSSYDRLSVILSDMARFVLCHRFGGIYLDADTIMLRDWEELWGWKGAFAYRWSRLPNYNTAVLRMNKGSALGTFLFRTALKNGLDFHPMTVSRYAADAYLENILLRLPDALFDSAWLNTENFQRDRPPQPYFTEFKDFFMTPAQNSAAPQALGFNGFFKGAYSYHFHNFWWVPFDAERNFPDLGTQFKVGENIARAALRKDSKVDDDDDDDDVKDAKRDLDWATVLKRTFEAYIRGERPNMYGEWLTW